jgi:hypothetical protein
LFEAFGHKGNIYIVTGFNPDEWVELGGKLFRLEDYD